ncbi:HTH-type transcriptional repressor yvoA [Chromobacterium violaceum]|nr:histidine utilization repressor [Chromobacterium violaceum]MBA8736983.1 histidine utilization repressor [Chromobacterium violaceum]QIY79253.1 histidine utilization repressor [Chromobacterium violaceum]SUX35149.1 HTH-type transcriptional repressor yvoA [Chromobacterium violaceum]SUX40413.1 HTH-type transcriptional repressor yvoA [Chromobacterium violaceum]
MRPLALQSLIPVKTGAKVSDAAQPRYQRIKDYILSGIRDRHFLPGCKIPPELELARQFGVSRMTVNKAVRDLAEAGILLRFAGDGTYVAERKAESPLLDINNIAAEIEARGHRHTAQVILLEAVPASEEVALRLSMRAGGIVYHSLIVHCEDDVPIQLEDRYVNPAFAPDYLRQDFSERTPNDYLMQSCPLTDIEHSVEAVLPGVAEQTLLGIAAAEPCLLVLRRTWSHKKLVSFARLTHPGLRYKLRSQTRVKK